MIKSWWLHPPAVNWQYHCGTDFHLKVRDCSAWTQINLTWFFSIFYYNRVVTASRPDCLFSPFFTISVLFFFFCFSSCVLMFPLLSRVVNNSVHLFTMYCYDALSLKSPVNHQARNRDITAGKSACCWSGRPSSIILWRYIFRLAWARLEPLLPPATDNSEDKPSGPKHCLVPSLPYGQWELIFKLFLATVFFLYKINRA